MKNGDLIRQAICDRMWPGLFYGMVFGTVLVVFVRHDPAIRDLKDRVKWYEGQQESVLIQMRQFGSDLARVRERLPPQIKGIGAKGEAAGAVEEDK